MADYHVYRNLPNAWILSGVPQGSILGPLATIQYLSLWSISYNKRYRFCKFADDNTPYCEGKNIEEVIEKLQKTANDLFSWFSNNEMKANPEKFQLILNTNEVHKLNLN